MTTDNNNTNSTIDEELIGKPYKGPTKLVWEDGRQIRKPDLSPQQTAANTVREFKYQKSLNETISTTDKTRFEKLQNDEEKYEMISNMITGSNNPNQLFSSRYIKGDPMSLIQILEDLVSERKIYLDPSSGNIYSYEFAIKEHMISFPCRNCSKVLFSEQERTRHAFSHMQQQSE